MNQDLKEIHQPDSYIPDGLDRTNVSIPVKFTKEGIKCIYNDKIVPIIEGSYGEVIVRGHDIVPYYWIKCLYEEQKEELLPNGSVLLIQVSINSFDGFSDELVKYLNEKCTTNPEFSYSSWDNYSEEEKTAIKERYKQSLFKNTKYYIELILLEPLYITLRGSKRATFDNCICISLLQNSELFLKQPQNELKKGK